MQFSGIHHIAIICSDYERSKRFYTETLGFEIVHEMHRKGRNSWKLDLKVDEHTQLELFSFPHPPTRLTQPEACGLRHLALKAADAEATRKELEVAGVAVEPMRVDDVTGKRLFFFWDPDRLPIEVQEL